MSNTLFQSEVWEQAWIEDPLATVNRMKRAGIDPATTMGERATSFNEQSFNEDGRRRTQRIMRWLQDQGVSFEQATVLDIGAASGVFSVPFAERGAYVTALEPAAPFISLLEENIKQYAPGRIELVQEPFEDISVAEKAWTGKFDLVFASMCPAISNWEMVEKALSCAKQFCYISTMAGPHIHSLIQALRAELGILKQTTGPSDMVYLLQILNLKEYSFTSLITKEVKTTLLPVDEAVRTTPQLLSLHGLPTDEATLEKAEAYIRRISQDGMVSIQQGGRFGKVLVQLQNQQMYTRETN